MSQNGCEGLGIERQGEIRNEIKFLDDDLSPLPPKTPQTLEIEMLHFESEDISSCRCWKCALILKTNCIIILIASKMLSTSKGHCFYCW